MAESKKNIHTRPDESSVWGNQASQQNEIANIDFNQHETPFIDPHHSEVNDNQIHGNQLKVYQQQVANNIQLQLTGAMYSEQHKAGHLAADPDSTIVGSAVNKFTTKMATSSNAMIAAVLVHVLLIITAGIYWKVDVGGFLNIPVTDAPNSNQAKPLPPLKSYLITQAEYDKLVERSALKSTVVDNAAIDAPASDGIDNAVLQPLEKARANSNQQTTKALETSTEEATPELPPSANRATNNVVELD
jgi:hypothetical protein